MHLCLAQPNLSGHRNQRGQKYPKRVRKAHRANPKFAFLFPPFRVLGLYTVFVNDVFLADSIESIDTGSGDQRH